ncbi:Nn.00g104510.m01.CDS01 [Neocucurbitaria sp. VM-36]
MAALVGKVDKALHLGGDGGSATAARKTCCVHEDERREKIERSGNGEVVEESGSQIETVERQLKPPSAFILTDQEVILPPGQAHSQAGINPHIQDRQASSTRNPPPTNVPPSQTSSSPHAHIAEASTHTTHDPLLQETSKTPFRPPTPEYPASSWIHLASILQTRNRYLERELEDYREMCNSLVQDVRWQMGAQGELEEQLEAERGEKERVLEELVGLKRRWRGVVGLVGGRSWSYECYGSIAGDASDGCGDDMGCEDFITLPRSSSPLYPQGDETSPQQYSTSTGESTDDRSSFRGDLATAESGTGNIAAPFFTFLPKLSMIIFPADTAQIFQFPGASTLSQIRSILEYKYRRGIEDNPCLVRVREIMQVREDMGVRLPEGLRDERLVIAIPEGGEEVEKEVKGWGIEGGEVGIEAWETWLDDDAEGLETMAGCLGVGVDDVDAFMRRSRETDDGSEDEDLDGDLGELNDSMVGTNDAYNDDESERVCECELCTNRDLNPYAETQSSYPPPLVSVRGGAGQEESSSPPGSDSNNESQCFESPHLPFSPFNQRMKRESSQESIRHEDDAPTPTTTTTRSSPKRADDYGVQNDKGRNYGEGNEYPFPIVEDPDLRLRGGGACDEDRKDGEENWSSFEVDITHAEVFTQATRSPFTYPKKLYPTNFETRGKIDAYFCVTAH